MIMLPVTSSDLESVGYDDASRNMKIRFHSGGVYSYSNVSHDVYDSLMSANSKGKYFHSHISGFYDEKRLN
jgi:hypothetical protein